MTAQSGSSFILKVGNGEVVEAFTEVCGMVTNSMNIRNGVVDSSTKSSGSWRKLLAAAGKRSVSISGSGSFEDSASEETVRALAFASNIKNFQISFGNGDVLTGPFIISSYQRSGDMDAEEKYSLTLESAGDVIYTVAV